MFSNVNNVDGLIGDSLTHSKPATIDQSGSLEDFLLLSQKLGLGSWIISHERRRVSKCPSFINL